jgi:hypothetical protein
LFFLGAGMAIAIKFFVVGRRDYFEGSYRWRDPVEGVMTTRRTSSEKNPLVYCATKQGSTERLVMVYGFTVNQQLCPPIA